VAGGRKWSVAQTERRPNCFREGYGTSTRFRTIQAWPKDLALLRVNNPYPDDPTAKGEIIMYLASPSLQIVPVPGIGFCNSIFVDRGAADRPRRVGRTLGPREAVLTERLSAEAADPAATDC